MVGGDDALRRQARALGDPTRHSIFRLIGEADRPPGVRELAGALGLHESAVRQHLAKLVGADLVVEGRDDVRARGRPRSVYRHAPGLPGVWGIESHVERLAALLLEVVRTGDEPREVGRAAGRAVGTAPAGVAASGDDGASAVEALADLVRAHGFDPTPAGAPGAPELVLGRCPFATLAASAPEIVCELHHGMAEGMAEVASARTGDGGGVAVTGLDRRDPRTGGCRILLRNLQTIIDSR